jgi:hypothetical protein
MKTINLTPTWGEWGNVLYCLAISSAEKSLKNLRPDMAKAFAAAEAYRKIQHKLPEDLAAEADAVFRAEMAKQGFALTSEEAV